MYTKGLLEITTPPCETWNDEDRFCDEEYMDGHVHSIRDSRSGKNWSTICVYLPHSCDQWVIGGAEQVQEMINDLQEALRILTSAQLTPNNCKHENVEFYRRMISRATLDQPAEYSEWAICLDCGDRLDPDDVPDEAEITDGDNERPARGMPSEFFD